MTRRDKRGLDWRKDGIGDEWSWRSMGKEVR